MNANEEPTADGAEPYTDLRALLRGNHGLHYVARYDGGRRVFDESLFGDDDFPLGDPEQDPSPTDRHRACRRIADKISFQTENHLDDWLAKLGTGPLIRTVVQSERGTVVCMQLVPGSYLVGVTIGAPTDPQPLDAVAEQADRALSRFIELSRDRLHVRELDLGGWESERLRDDLRAARASGSDTAEDTGEWNLAGDAPPHIAGATGHPAVDVCRSVVRARDLHRVALFRDEAEVFSIDVFHDHRLDTGEDGELRADERREEYHRIGRELPDYVRELGRTARQAIGGPVQRAVFDVAEGAIYYRRLDQSHYLKGLTLYQKRVKQAEDQFTKALNSWPR